MDAPTGLGCSGESRVLLCAELGRATGVSEKRQVGRRAPRELLQAGMVREGLEIRKGSQSSG